MFFKNDFFPCSLPTLHFPLLDHPLLSQSNPLIYFPFYPASSACQPSHAGSTAAHCANATLVWGLIGQYAGAAAVRPEPARSSNILQGKLFSLSEASGWTGELSDDSHNDRDDL